MVGVSIGLVAVLVGSLGQQAIAPPCVAEPGRRAERVAATLEAQYLTPLSSLVARCGRLTADGRPTTRHLRTRVQSPGPSGVTSR